MAGNVAATASMETGSTTNNRLASGGEVFVGNKPVVRVTALTGVKRPIAPLVTQAVPQTQQRPAPNYQMIQIGSEVFKVATMGSPAHNGTDDIEPASKQSDNRQYYSDMPEGAPTTMIISKAEKDNSNDGYSSDEASDLSLQLEDARCHTAASATAGNLTAIVQGPDGQFFVPVRSLGSSVNNNILLNADYTMSSDLDDSGRKRELRLLKNREAAKECRRKKKDYVRCLENRVALLENQNKTLINELKSLKELYCQKEAHS